MTPTCGCAPLTLSFEAHDIDAATFHHAEHMQVAFDLLRKYDFIDASAIYAKGIRAIAAKSGASRKFNLTITYAFMSLIAERLAAAPDCDFAGFAARNPDLMSQDALAQWYDRDRLDSDMARAIFLLPKMA